MVFKKIEINNFKCIDKLEFKPKKINLIVGRNNTGKLLFWRLEYCV